MTVTAAKLEELAAAYKASVKEYRKREFKVDRLQNQLHLAQEALWDLEADESYSELSDALRAFCADTLGVSVSLVPPTPVKGNGMALTCDRCLSGDARRCRRGNCAA